MILHTRVRTGTVILDKVKHIIHDFVLYPEPKASEHLDLVLSSKLLKFQKGDTPSLESVRAPVPAPSDAAVGGGSEGSAGGPLAAGSRMTQLDVLKTLSFAELQVIAQGLAPAEELAKLKSKKSLIDLITKGQG